MIEYGLSVSLDGTPNKTPITPRGSDSQEEYGYDAPPGHRHCCRRARKMNFGDLMMVCDHDAAAAAAAGDGEKGVDEYESISPRVCFSEIVRRLDFTVETSELSPVSFSSVSVSVPRNNGVVVAVAAVAEEDVCCSELQEQQQCIIGECGVCYQLLTERRNHVFTLCGHLFCVQCLLKWWNTSSTCPICRAALLIVNEDDEVDDDDTVIYADAALDADAAAMIDAELDDAVFALEENEGHRNNDAAWMQPPAEYLAVGENYDNSDGDSDDHDDDDDNPHQEPYFQNVTLLNRYIHQDCNLLWSVIVCEDGVDPNYDDTVYQLSDDEIRGLRENREIAMTLFARMRFRETLFHPDRQFHGSVWCGSWVHILEWVDIVGEYQRNLSSIQSVMYEFVIRRGSDISPTNEVSIFGFIKDVTMQETENSDNYGSGGDSVEQWENTVEYAFVAEVFTPTDFYIQGVWGNPNLISSFRSYGSYNMTDGTINTQELVITFSQVRRLYRINGWESCEA
jgi:hypothetical protein